MASLANCLHYLRADLDRLSNRTAIYRDRIQEIADGAEPTTTELRLIADYFKLPASALYRIQELVDRPEIRFRSTGQQHEPIADAARISEIGKFLSEAGIPTGAPSDFRVQADLQNHASIEDAAILIRERLLGARDQLDPLIDLPSRLDANGIAVTVVLHGLKVDGATTRIGGHGLILVAARTFVPRMLFTCAHELAHLLLGHVDNNQWLIDEDTIEAFGEADDDERLCNVLASAILLPAQGLALFLRTLKEQIGAREDAISSVEVAYLARYFGMSFLATAMRLELLDILPPGSGLAFEREIRRDYPSAEAYGDSLNIPPRQLISMPALSLRLRNDVNDALMDGTISIGRASETFGHSISEMTNAGA